MKPMVVTYETGGAYRQSAAELVESGKKFGADVKVYTRPDRGVWWANVLHKTEVIAKTVAAASRPVLYLDADCRIVGSLDALFDAVGRTDVPDLMIRHRPSAARDRYNTGVLLMVPNTSTRMFTNLWNRLVQRYGHRYETCDQGYVAQAMTESGLSVGPLDPKYNVFASDACADPRITHSKASRTDPIVAAWKAGRRLERFLVNRTKTLLKRPAPPRLYLYGREKPIPNVPPGAEVHTVDRTERDARVAWAWYSDAEPLVAPKPTGCEVRLCSADMPLYGVADLFRGRISPKPSEDNPPRYVHLYHAIVGFAKSTEQGELCGPNPWTAALNAFALRGGKEALVHCPPAMRVIVEDACRALNLKLL